MSIAKFNFLVSWRLFQAIYPRMGCPGTARMTSIRFEVTHRKLPVPQFKLGTLHQHNRNPPACVQQRTHLETEFLPFGLVAVAPLMVTTSVETRQQNIRLDTNSSATAIPEYPSPLPRHKESVHLQREEMI